MKRKGKGKEEKEEKEEGSQGKEEQKKNIKSLSEEETESLLNDEIKYFTIEYEKVSYKRFKDKKQTNHLTSYHPDAGYAAEFSALLIMAGIRRHHLLHVAKMPPSLLQMMEDDAKQHALELFKDITRDELNQFHKEEEEKEKQEVDNNNEEGGEGGGRVKHK
jgi:hypothetical protein